MTAGAGRTGADSGNAPLELVMLAPVVLFLIGLVIAAGRITLAQGAVAAAARSAAREASISLSAATARQAAISTAVGTLSGDGLNCRPVVRLDLAGFAVPPGRSAMVSATVICTVRLSDLLVPGLPGSRTLRASFASPLDPYRSRALGPGPPRRVTAPSHLAAQNPGPEAGRGRGPGTRRRGARR